MYKSTIETAYRLWPNLEKIMVMGITFDAALSVWSPKASIEETSYIFNRDEKRIIFYLWRDKEAQPGSYLIFNPEQECYLYFPDLRRRIKDLRAEADALEKIAEENQELIQELIK